MASNAGKGGFPSVAVIVPALNEAGWISHCLTALRAQTYPATAVEPIVVDNGSTDGTTDIVRRHGVRLLFEPRRSAYHARNTAILDSTGDYLAFTDADCIPEPTWLERLVDAAERTQAPLAGGLTLYDIVRDTLGNRLLAESHDSQRLHEYITRYHCVAAGNLLVRRATFERHGLFRTALSGADIEFSKRVAGAGSLPLFVPEAIVRHQCDLSSWAYLRRSFGEQRGQALHADADASERWQALFITLIRAPWRPDVSRLLRALRGGSAGERLPALAEWGYRWLERWFGYAGRVSGRVALLRGVRYPVPEYRVNQ